jgi:hypothetical protein
MSVPLLFHPLGLFSKRGVGCAHWLSVVGVSPCGLSSYFFFLLLPLPLSVHAEHLSELSANPFNSDSTSNPFGAGSPFKTDGLNDLFSPYGSPFSNQSATNPFATNAPRLYDQQGNNRGRLSANQYDPDSTSNPYGRYGSPFSPDSIKNPYGAGSPYSPSSPTNPYGRGLRIEGR